MSELYALCSYTDTDATRTHFLKTRVWLGVCVCMCVSSAVQWDGCGCGSGIEECGRCTIRSDQPLRDRSVVLVGSVGQCK